jgi:UDP-N-acetyl-2-amino-2-deoxyglucuronate dehydrogenase
MTRGFGIVGTGMISQFHAKAIAAMAGAELVACFDMSSERAEAFAKTNDCLSYSNLDEMLANEDVDIVTICTPSGAHRDPAVAAAKAGKHVLVEKPLEITLNRCDDITNACAANNVKLGAILPSRFSGANLELKKAIDAGRFGKLTLADMYVKWWRTQAYYDSGGWRGTWALDGGGAYMNQAIHNVDLLLWFMGDVAQVCGMTATLAHERIEVEDTGAAVVRFKNGAIGTMEATTSAYPGLLKKVEIHGTEGSAIIEQDSILLWNFKNALPEDEQILAKYAKTSETSGGASDPSAISFIGHQKQFEDFVAAINSNQTPAIDGHQGRKSVELILGIYQSSWSGKRVDLPLQKDPDRPA